VPRRHGVPVRAKVTHLTAAARISKRLAALKRIVEGSRAYWRQYHAALKNKPKSEREAYADGRTAGRAGARQALRLRRKGLTELERKAYYAGYHNGYNLERRRQVIAAHTKAEAAA
jgi:hypothetical protein